MKSPMLVLQEVIAYVEPRRKEVYADLMVTVEFAWLSNPAHAGNPVPDEVKRVTDDMLGYFMREVAASMVIKESINVVERRLEPNVEAIGQRTIAELKTIVAKSTELWLERQASQLPRS